MSIFLEYCVAAMGAAKRLPWRTLVLGCILCHLTSDVTSTTTSSRCDVLPAFWPDATAGRSAARCKTCLLPAFPAVKHIERAQHHMLNMHDKQLLFFGDMTLRQMHGEFAGLAHGARVSTRPLLKLRHEYHVLAR